MVTRFSLFNVVKIRISKMPHGMRSFFRNLSIVTACFAASKVFSSIATVIMARFLGRDLFGEASVILLVAQVLCPVMLLGLHMSVMRYGASQKNAAPWLSTSFYAATAMSVIVLLTIFGLRSFLASWLDITRTKIYWAMALAALMSAYLLFTHFYQTLNLYKERGALEILLGFGLLPGLAVGYWIAGTSYEMALFAYLITYMFCMPPMILRFYKMLSLKNLFAPNTPEMLKYGSFACFGGIGYILTFVIQPLQLNHYTGEGEVGLFRLYSSSSISLATFATTIFYIVFFPKVAASENRNEIWRLMTKAWVKAALPLMIIYAGVFSLSVGLAGDQFPLTWTYVLLFSVASILITIQNTYGQLVAAQGISGMRWVLAQAVGSGGLNFLLSMWLIPLWGIYGAVITLIVNFSLSLLFLLSLRNQLFQR
jgi:O-antigen/teichoic acid export membrane protein